MYLDKKAEINVFLKFVAILPYLSDFDSNIAVTIATEHAIIIKPFIWIPRHVLGHNNFDMWQKTLK